MLWQTGRQTDGLFSSAEKNTPETLIVLFYTISLRVSIIVHRQCDHCVSRFFEILSSLGSNDVTATRIAAGISKAERWRILIAATAEYVFSQIHNRNLPRLSRRREKSMGIHARIWPRIRIKMKNSGILIWARHQTSLQPNMISPRNSDCSHWSFAWTNQWLHSRLSSGRRRNSQKQRFVFLRRFQDFRFSSTWFSSHFFVHPWGCTTPRTPLN